VEEIEISRRGFVTGAGAASVGLTVALLPSAVAATSVVNDNGAGGGGNVEDPSGPYLADLDMRVTSDGWLEIRWQQGSYPSPFNYNYSYSVGSGTVTPQSGHTSGGATSPLSSTTGTAYVRIGRLSPGATVTITGIAGVGTSTKTVTNTSGPYSSGYVLQVDTDANLSIRWNENSWTGPFSYTFSYTITNGSIRLESGFTSTAGLSTASTSGTGTLSSASDNLTLTLIGVMTPGSSATVTVTSLTSPSTTRSLAGTHIPE